MKSLVITPENEKDLEFLRYLMVKLGYSISELSEEDMEDMGLLRAMVQEKRAEYVSEKNVRKALGKK